MELIDLFIDPSLEDKSGVSAIALVDSPAIESNWVAFASHTEKPELKHYKIQLASQKGDLMAVEGDQQMLFGAFMIPDMEILRMDEKTGKKYNVKFSPETIKAISEKYALSNINTNLNEMHNNSMPISGGVVQHFIIDSKNGINAPFNQKLKDGTWAGYIKVLDKNKWDTFVKTGIYTGFSVEGHFYEKPSKPIVSEAEMDAMRDFLESISNQI